jgi:glycosyltransferase involved in cell wall biosynthesis
MSHFKFRNVLFILPTLGGGGAERVTSNVAAFLSRKSELDIHVSVVVLLQESHHVQVPGLNVIRFNSKSVTRSLLKIVSLFIALRPVVVISTLKHVTFWSSIACRLVNIPHVSRVANTLSVETTGSIKWSVISKINYILDKSIIAVSDGVKRDLMSSNMALGQKIKVIPNPVLLPKCWNPHPIREEGAPIKALFVGRLVKQKNIEFLINVIAKNKEKINLCIVGDGPLRDSLLKLSQNLGVESQVLFVGHANDVNQYYIKSDVVLLSSFFEGMPNVLLEALSNGIPVVSYDCPSGPADIIKSAVLGSLVYKLDEENFFQCIYNEFLNDNESKRLARRKWVELNYDISRVAMKYFDVISGLSK